MNFGERVQDFFILSRINRGDPKAFTEMYERYATRIYRHVLFRVSSKETAEDIAAQVFFKAWEYCASGKTIRDIKAFLYRIAANLIIDHYRAQANLKVAEDSEEILQTVPGRHDTLDEAIAHDARREIMTMLSCLSEEQREIITMRYFDDCSVKQIAAITGKSPNAISVMLHRVLRKLHESETSGVIIKDMI